MTLKAQILIKGEVVDSNNIPVQAAGVVLSNSSNEIINYTYTDESGRFNLEIQRTSTNVNLYTLTVNMLGFEDLTEKVTVEPKKDQYFFILTLKEKVEQLHEVVLKPDEKISANGNVTTIKTAPFMDQSEQNVEDVLKKLPGIEVLEDGSIKAHGKFIKKLMIDGDDMFANDYQILSKNLDAKTLDAVQIIDNYQGNPVLAKVLDSDEVALNLELKDEFKNVWFGNGSLGLGSEERFRGSANIGLLKEKIKFFYLGDYNNLGNKAADQLEGSPTSLSITSAYREVQIEPEIEPVFAIHKNESHVLKDDQSIFNEAFMNSLGLVTKINSDLELRAKGSFAKDDQEQLFFSRSVFQVEENPIEYTENSRTNHKNMIGSGELELKYTGGKRSYLRNVLSYRNQPENLNNQIIFNGNEVEQDLDKNEYALYNHLNYSYVLGESSVLHNYVYIGQTEITQNALINSASLNDFFSLPENSKIEQNNNDQLKVFGVNSNLFSEYGEFTHRLQVGYESSKEDRETKIYRKPTGSKEIIDSLQNDLNYRQEKFKFTTSLSYTFSEKAKLSLGASLDNLKLSSGFDQLDKWIFNPEIDLDLRKLKAGRLAVGYENSYSTPDSYLLFQNYQLNSYNSFVRGADNIYLIKKDVYKFYYKWANTLESQALTFNLRYDDLKGNYSSINQIGENLRLTSYEVIEGSDHISSNLSFASFFEELNFSSNLRSTQNWTRRPFLVNSEEFEDLKVYSSTYSISGTTYFRMPLNFRFHMNFNFSESEYDSVVSKSQWSNWALNLNYNFSNEWHLNIYNNYYSMPSSSYYFLNSTLNYQPDSSDFSYRLVFNNLTNEKRFSTVFIDDFTTYQSSIRLLPRYIFASVKYRF